MRLNTMAWKLPLKIKSCPSHWHRLVKNIGERQTKLLGERVVITAESMGISQLVVDTCPGCSLSKVYASDQS